MKKKKNYSRGFHIIFLIPFFFFYFLFVHFIFYSYFYMRIATVEQITRADVDTCAALGPPLDFCVLSIYVEGLPCRTPRHLFNWEPPYNRCCICILHTTLMKLGSSPSLLQNTYTHALVTRMHDIHKKGLNPRGNLR